MLIVAILTNSGVILMPVAMFYTKITHIQLNRYYLFK